MPAGVNTTVTAKYQLLQTPDHANRGNSKETSTMIKETSDANNGPPSSANPSMARRAIIYQNPKGGKNKSKWLKIFSGSIALVVVIVIIALRVSWRSNRQSYNTIEYHPGIKPMPIPEIPEIPSIDIGKKVPWNPSKEHETYCTTKTCREVIDSITQTMDAYTDPCMNFYQYACGNWIGKSSPAYEDNFILLGLENQMALRKLIERHPNGKNTAEDKARIYYASCFDEDDDVEKLGSEPILSLLKEIGGWNISGNFDIKEWDLQKTLQVLYNLPTAAKPFSWGIGVDLKKSSENIIQLDEGKLALNDKKYYQKGNLALMAVYLKYMVKVGVLLGGKEESTRAQMIDVILFELKLAYMISDKTENIELLYNKMTLSALMEMAPAINWLQYFNFAFKETNRKILPSDLIIVSSPEFILQMSQLIDEYLSTTEGRITLSNYLGWSLVQGLTAYLPKSFQIGSDVIEKQDAASDLILWYTCLQKVDNAMPFALGAIFVKDAFENRIKRSMEQMINDIREAFKENLYQLNWLDDETKELVKDKIDAIAVSVGYPDFIMEPEKLNKYYENLELVEYEYFKNTISLKKFLVRKNMMKLDEPVNRLEWQLSPPSVNAYYSPIRNQIVVPAGILKKPFYAEDYPKFLSFSRLGFLIGHELMHAVDNKGRLFDKYGNLYSWWKNSTIRSFDTKARCFVDQYSNYNENYIYLNGTRTLPDNIADNGGLKTAFSAYENWVKTHLVEAPPFTSQGLSSRKLFFIGFAQMWCAKTTPEYMKESLREWDHSPHKFRVIGALSNSDDFRKDFKCPGTKISIYRKSKKCELW